MQGKFCIWLSCCGMALPVRLTAIAPYHIKVSITSIHGVTYSYYALQPGIHIANITPLSRDGAPILDAQHDGIRRRWYSLDDMQCFEIDYTFGTLPHHEQLLFVGMMAMIQENSDDEIPVMAKSLVSQFNMVKIQRWYRHVTNRQQMYSYRP